jgi:hypothetical protein
MSFFKKAGGLLGNILGIRSGSSSQVRQFAEDWGFQQRQLQADMQAQQFGLRASTELTSLQDEAEAKMADTLRKEAAASQPQVELANANNKARQAFFRFR